MWTRSKAAWQIRCGTALCTILAGQLARASVDDRPAPAGLAKEVISDDPAVARRAADRLRAMGPDGLGLLMSNFDREIRHHTGRQRAEPSPRHPAHAELDAVGWSRLSAAIDVVAAQKDAAYSGLYWHIDLEAAKAAARRSGRPILSLRLLGTLDTEFSCANSRFFRTVLYANEDVSAALRDRFILHWQSVRPAPKVTIDMGDGRIIHRTITGNSVHYVLDVEGRPIDAIPGLYGPRAFLRAIGDAAVVARAAGGLSDRGARLTLLRNWHGGRAARLTAAWEQDLASIGAARELSGATMISDNTTTGAFPSAARAARAAVGKSMVELNIVRALAPRVAILRASTTDEVWAKLSALPAHTEAARLDDASRELVAAKHPTAIAAARNTMAKAATEDPLVRVLANLERSVAEDTVRNEYNFHRTVHEWFAGGMTEASADDVGPLNERIYAELFLTPSSDPWLGLVAADTYSALAGDGITASSATTPPRQSRR